MAGARTNTVQTPGSTSATDSGTSAADQALQGGDTARDSALAGALETPATEADRIGSLEQTVKQLLQANADLQSLVRKTVETGIAPAPVKLPTEEEALKQVANADRPAPMLSQAGWVVPDSDKWAVSRGDQTRK